MKLNVSSENQSTHPANIECFLLRRLKRIKNKLNFKTETERATTRSTKTKVILKLRSKEAPSSLKNKFIYFLSKFRSEL